MGTTIIYSFMMMMACFAFCCVLRQTARKFSCHRQTSWEEEEKEMGAFSIPLPTREYFMDELIKFSPWIGSLVSQSFFSGRSRVVLLLSGNESSVRSFLPPCLSNRPEETKRRFRGAEITRV